MLISRGLMLTILSSGHPISVYLLMVQVKSSKSSLLKIKYKFETTQILTNFIKSTKIQYNLHVKAVGTKNSSEFNSLPCLRAWYKPPKIHTLHISTKWESRKKTQRHLNLARCLLFQTGLSLKFWDDAVQTAVCILNRLPISVLNWKFPYEILKN